MYIKRKTFQLTFNFSFPQFFVRFEMDLIYYEEKSIMTLNKGVIVIYI